MNKFYNNMKTALLLGLMTSLILFAGMMIVGQQGLIIAFLLAAVMNVVSFFFSDKIALMSLDFGTSRDFKSAVTVAVTVSNPE